MTEFLMDDWMRVEVPMSPEILARVHVAIVDGAVVVTGPQDLVLTVLRVAADAVEVFAKANRP